LLSCRIEGTGVASGPVCCRLVPFHAAHAESRVRRYPSDTTDAQWTLIDALLPDPAWLAGQGGRREVHCRRAIVDAIFYLVDNGIKWRAMPADFPPWSTVYNYFAAWEKVGITQHLLDDLRDRVRLREGRAAEPTAAIIDSQSVKAAETVAQSYRGYDAGKKTSDAECLSSRNWEWVVGRRGEGGGFVEGDALCEAVVEAADHAVEEVALSGGVPVTGLPTAVVVASGSG
jgi:transposase